MVGGILIAGIAYFIMFFQFLFYSDDSITLRKLIIRGSISLIFVISGLYLVFSNKTKADKRINL